MIDLALEQTISDAIRRDFRAGDEALSTSAWDLLTEDGIRVGKTGTRGGDERLYEAFAVGEEV